ncbi:Uncharacterised protein [Legionella steigerwaltii]|uniref:Phospholipid/glycerol acyltransferase domain-containing protein n=1 Tax=Legionella steigerwaltii TaxID=460 RepID=A0A378LBS2_9GAMM|nr:1-acyl-sn-glycerol-3-phosphate acyltransferase [Legionella steigerwaltii]KTD80984.1 hypothetical protein Lstg_0211 [Legionella steigerwaltii]STY23328.1 Uncharacterised protein [Legionella steigerwaltii]
MPGLDSRLDLHNDNDDFASSAYNLLYLLIALVTVTYLLARYFESRNRLNYESRSARIISGLIKVTTDLLHTKSGDLKITGHEGQIIAVGPHRTGLVDGAVVASKMEGIPPHIFATDVYNFIPGVRSFMEMFQAITIKAQATKSGDGRSANAEALEKAGKVLREKGCLALFPQGNFAKIGQEPHRVYDGAAKLAVKNNAAIRVLRLDGFWSIDNPFIPVFVRNNSIYRALGSFFHMNNVRVTECCVIDFHTKPESENLSESEKIEKICVQLYAFYRRTENLSVEQIRAIKREVVDISNKTHHLIWAKKLKHDGLVKELTALDAERAELEKTALTSMNVSSMC